MTDVFVTDPIVPVELGMPAGPRFTLYQPGWQQAKDGAAAFLGAENQIYVFESLADLRTFVQSSATHDMSPSPFYAAVQDWSMQDYTDRLCAYSLDEPPELSDNRLAEHEQLALGSSLALLLDLLDFAGVEGESADRLRNDNDVDRLAQGHTIDAVFGGAKRRQRIVDLVTQTWGPCVDAVSQQLTTPATPTGSASTSSSSSPAAETSSVAEPGTPTADEPTGADQVEDDATGLADVPDDARDIVAADTGTEGAQDLADDEGGTPLEEVVPALTMWFAFADVGVYTVRTIDVAFGHPTYLGRYTKEAQLHLLGAREPEDLKAAIRKERVNPLPGVNLATAAADPEVTFAPADDNIFDLVEIGEAIGPELSVDDADRLVTAWVELIRLADWASWSDVKELLDVNSPVGRYITSCAIDVAQDRPHAQDALESAESDDARQGWSKAVETVFTYVTMLDTA